MSSAYTTEQLARWIEQAIDEAARAWNQSGTGDEPLREHFMFPTAAAAGICMGLPHAKCLMLNASMPSVSTDQIPDSGSGQGSITMFAAQVDDVVFWRGEPGTLDELKERAINLVNLASGQETLKARCDVQVMDNARSVEMFNGRLTQQIGRLIADRVRAHEQAAQLEAASPRPVAIITSPGRRI